MVPILVIAEATFLLGRSATPAMEPRLLADLSSGAFQVEPVAAADWSRILELVLVYRDLKLGTADASVVAVAERLGISRVATLDRRHFSVVRPRHVERFELPLLG